MLNQKGWSGFLWAGYELGHAMASLKSARLAAAAAIGFAAALSVSEVPIFESAIANPARKEVGNTGAPAGPAFLIDLRQGIDKDAHYLADYSMNQDWIKVAFNPANIRFDKTGMTLELIKTSGRIPFSGSEFQRNGTYGYGRYEVVMTASPAYGAISSFFIYTGEQWGDPHDEIDFEFVGRKPREVYLNYFRNGVSDGLSVPLWFDASRGDHLYAFEWSPTFIRWYVDGIRIREVNTATAKAGIPKTTGRVIANMWAGVGPSTDWTGVPQFKRAKASYRCISHVPMNETGKQCSDVFKGFSR